MSKRQDTVYRECKAMIVGSDDEQGIVEMVVSVFGVEDYGRDVMEKGCFKESLQRKLPKGIWMHDGTLPVAKTLEAKELSPNDARLPDAIKTYGGLYIKSQFNLSTQRGKEAYSDIKFGIIDEFSIGFIADKDTTRIVKNVRYIKKAWLIEWSPVLIGMNPLTQVISVKGGSTMEIENKAQYLGEYVEQRATASACEAVINALFWKIYQCVYEEGKTLEEKVTFVEACANEAAMLVTEIVRNLLSIAEPEELETASATLKSFFVEPAQLQSVSPRTGITLKTQIEVAHTANQSLLERMSNIAAWKAADRGNGRAMVLSQPNRETIVGQIAQLKSVLAGAENLLQKTAPADTSHKPDPIALQLHLKRLAARLGKYKELRDENQISRACATD